jgi:uncharacterized membrane-anchored protein
MKPSPLLRLFAFLLLTSAAFAAPKSEADEQKILDSLKWRADGTIPLEGDAAIRLQNGFRYLDSADATKVLSDLWGNPRQETLGMIFPPGDNESWSVVVEGFEKEGYVKDDDADKIDAPKILKEMQESQKEANEDRRKEGLAELEVVGWAVPPRYDKQSKKLFWALDIKRIGSDRHSVNYYIRILGRHGYLVLNALGSLDEIPKIEAATPQVVGMIEFNEGHRYADFNPKTDKVAAYGLGGLILGAVGLKAAAKLGLLALFAKKFGVILLALKKLWIVIIAGLATLVKKIKGFFGRKDESTAGNFPS